MKSLTTHDFSGNIFGHEHFRSSVVLFNPYGELVVAKKKKTLKEASISQGERGEMGEVDKRGEEAFKYPIGTIFIPFS